ncbi:hypothetical protein AAOE16_05360 [Ekhidna sp. MALMAid0563]|uniref:hypothetical protein n=1 Tax=Ekhidna sp. MALMAid0563 TaxID=3143937 RepID=UPI0032DF095A
MKPIFILFIITTTTPILGQLRYPAGVINVNTTPGVGIVEELRPEAEEVKNVLYLYDDWKTIVFTIANDEKKYRFPGRIDILNDRIELKDSRTLKVIQGRLINYILLQDTGSSDRFFIRNNSFDNQTEFPLGFYEVLTEGKINLLKLYGYLLLQSSYNPALDVGNRSPELRLTEGYVIMKNNSAFELPNKKKEIFALLGDSAESISKKESLNPKKDEELIQLITLLNQK